MTLFARCASSAALLMVWLFAVDLISVAAQESESTEKQEQLVEEDRITPAKNEPVANEKEKKAEIPPAVDVYMGRRVAQTMHYLGAEWLIRNEREREERCSMMLANLGIKPGMTICDMGCGNGFYTLQMAQLTGENGYVVGVDVQPEMLSMLRTRMEDRGIENIVPILGSYHDPRLPPNINDLILLVDVYHEFSHPEQMLAAMRKSLKPDGLMVLVEYRAEDPEVPIKKLHKMSKKQVDKEMTANGFKLVKEFNGLPWQHMMFYGKDEQGTSNQESSIDE